jgi:hypothetical protein
MNKIVDVNYRLCEYEEFNCYDVSSVIYWNSFDGILLESYGLEFIKAYDVSLYKVVDESKFALFMLKYSDYIDEITYE